MYAESRYASYALIATETPPSNHRRSIIDSAEIVRWVSESKRPFEIVNDWGFQSLMKTGRPDYQIPSAITVSRDVKKVFMRIRKQIAKMLQVKSVLLGQLIYLNDLPCRSMKELSVLLRMPGHRPIIRHTSLSQYTLNTKVFLSRCFSISLRLRNPTLVSTWQQHFFKSLRNSALVIRYVEFKYKKLVLNRLACNVVVDPQCDVRQCIK